MVRDVVTVRPDMDVADAIKLLSEHDVSALPVVDEAGNLVGILSEADLIHRVEIGTEKRRPWWLEAVTGASTLAEEFAKSHGKKVGEIMTSGAISVSEDTPLSEIAALFERKRIKRVPVVKDGKLVGIVSRVQPDPSARLGGRPHGSARRDGPPNPARIAVSAARHNRGPILATETSPLATASCTSGGSSARRQNARHCSRWPKTCPECPGLLTK